MNYPKGHEFEFKVLRPSQIRVDPLYQRDLDTKRVDKIVKEFNGDTFNEPKVSYRNGIFWVFDGQHSIAAWRQYHGEDKLVNCKVFKGMTWLDECEAFVRQNGIKKDPTTNEKLKAEYNARNPEVVDMKTKAELCGFTVDFSLSKSATRIVATSTLFRAYKTLSSEAYLDMLTAIKEAWYGDIDAVSKYIINGMTAFYKTYHGNFSNDELVKSLKRVTPAEIIRNGKSFKRANAYGLEILKAYNVRRSRSRLENLL
jgi:hypothetical protein